MGYPTAEEDKIAAYIQGHAAFQSLWAACELRLFDLLSNKPDLTRSEISKELKIKEYPLRILLMSLSAMEILKCENLRYRNTDTAEELLVSSRHGNIIPILAWQNHIVYKGLQNFTDSLRACDNLGIEYFQGQGETLYERLSCDKPLERIFQDAMSALSSLANQEMVRSGVFAGIRHLLDVGGGDATNAIALAREYPELKVTIFDSESVCGIARENIARYDMEQRISVSSGNAFVDPFPEGVDGILFSHMFTIFSPEKNQALIDKCYDILPADGSVFVFNMMSNDTEDGPLTTVLGSLYFLAIASGEGMLYPWKDYEQWFNNSGFTQVRRVEGLPHYHGIFIGKK